VALVMLQINLLPKRRLNYVRISKEVRSDANFLVGLNGRPRAWLAGSLLLA
jgi:hypothetical protein